MVRRCSFCDRLLPVRPGTFNATVSHVCRSHSGAHVPQGSFDVSWVSARLREEMDREKFLVEAGCL